MTIILSILLIIALTVIFVLIECLNDEKKHFRIRNEECERWHKLYMDVLDRVNDVQATFAKMKSAHADIVNAAEKAKES